MTDRCEYLVGGYALKLTEKCELADMCVAALRNIDHLLTNFGKNWHADCRDNTVSKILDWLVQ
jgi:hypothetical protein